MIQNFPIIVRQDMIRCALCKDPPCDTVCEKVKPADLLRSVWFRNEQTAAQKLPEKNGWKSRSGKTGLFPSAKAFTAAVSEVRFRAEMLPEVPP